MLQDRNEFYGLYKRGNRRAFLIDFNKGEHFKFYYFGSEADAKRQIKEIEIQYGFKNATLTELHSL